MTSKTLNTHALKRIEQSAKTIENIASALYKEDNNTYGTLYEAIGQIKREVRPRRSKNSSTSITLHDLNWWLEHDNLGASEIDAIRLRFYDTISKEKAEEAYKAIEKSDNLETLTDEDIPECIIKFEKEFDVFLRTG